MTTTAYDTLGALLSDTAFVTQLRAELAGWMATNKRPYTMTCLLNSHLGSDRLICPNLPPDANIPWRHEKTLPPPLPGLVPELVFARPIGTGAALERFARCSAIYQ